MISSKSYITSRFTVNSIVTDAQDTAMYLLLKQTIGKGLGLL
jgi:hypothetical protein